ncbi:MAG: dihydrolipoyl dehydrogenase [Porphyromonas sp.]|nr:dihydrolipoyl dehydrogenase [Porphyromonas sp.]
MNFDLAIIGGGPAGYTAAERAAKGGLKTVLFEQNALGGTCLNEGCIPTKTLLYSAKVLETVQTAAKYGINCSAGEVDAAKILARKTKVVRKLVAGIKAKMANAGVTVIAESAIVTGGEEGNFTVVAGNETYQAAHLLLCTGSETVIPPIPGVEETHYKTSREALMDKEIPSSIAIIGGGVIGMEFAAYYREMGAEVYVVEMLPEIINGMDKALAAQLREQYAKRGIKFYLNHKVTALADGAVTVEFEDESFVIEVQEIMLSVGRRPVTSAFEALPIDKQGRGVKVDGFMRTSMPGVYAAGDITGFSLLAHTAVREAEVAVDHLLGKSPRPMSYKAIPGVVYTHPEIAGVGKTEDALIAEGTPYRKQELPLAFAGRFVAENEMGNGVCKVLVAPDDSILGVHILGAPASEIIVLAGVAIEQGIKAHQLAAMIFPHPTVGEIIKETIEAMAD